jgi:hypothetical protein
METHGLACSFRVIAIVALCACGCGNPVAPSKIAGYWTGRDGSAHFAAVQIRFEQQGSGIGGTACRLDGQSLSFTGVPVYVDGSRVTFTAFPGQDIEHVFVGRFTSDGETLNGAWTHSSEQIVMTRGGDLCANAH